MALKKIEERHVRQQYILVKAHCPNVAALIHDPGTGKGRAYWLGPMHIGDTAREAYQFLAGLRAGILAAPFLYTKAG